MQSLSVFKRLTKVLFCALCTLVASGAVQVSVIIPVYCIQPGNGLSYATIVNNGTPSRNNATFGYNQTSPFMVPVTQTANAGDSVQVYVCFQSTDNPNSVGEVSKPAEWTTLGMNNYRL